MYPHGFSEFAPEKDKVSTDEPVGDQEELHDEEFITHLDPSAQQPGLDDPDNLDPPSAPLPTHPEPASRLRIVAPAFCEVIQLKLRALLFALFAQLPVPELNG